jgi:glycosyltransferase involved in cell wall biosynthesis
MTSCSVLHVNTERGLRGGEIQTLLLARGLQGRGHRCHLAVSPGSPLEAKGREEGLEVFPLACRGEFDLAAVVRLAGLLRRVAPDLVHYHTSHAITLGTLASLFAGRRKAVATRRVSFPLDRNPLARIKYRLRLDRIIAVSEGIREILAASGVPRDRVTVIPSAVDLRRFAPPPDREACRRELGYSPEDFVVGSIGHLAAHKGHEILVEAASRLAPANPALRFLLVGRGEREADLRRRIAAAGLGGRFSLSGFREEVAPLLAALDLLALPSLSGEGSPAVLKEAMACGVPVVASDISGVREIVRPDMEGLLVSPGDPGALAEAILFFAADRGRGAEFGRRGRDRSGLFGADRMVERTESLYRDLLAT